MGGAAGCRLPVPDGGRTAADDCKFADNRKRALGAWLFDPGEAFTADSPLIPDASDSERLTAACLLERALERTRRASLASKDSRTAAALTKWEELVLLIPSLQNLRKLEFEGDYDTSEANERVLLVAAEYIRGRPKNALGDLVKADTVAGAVSALTRAAEGFYGRKVLCASGGLLLRDSLQAMRREDGPAGDRALSIPMRQSHLAALAGEDCPFDIMSPGWPQVRWAMMQASHQALMRGGEPGRVPRQPFRPALGICWKHLTWLDPASREAATVEIEGATHHLLFLAVRPIKDQKGTHKRVPIPIVSKHPVEEGLADLTCPFAAIRRAWDARVGLAPWCRLQDAPFFTGPDGVSAVSTDVSRAGHPRRGSLDGPVSGLQSEGRPPFADVSLTLWRELAMLTAPTAGQLENVPIAVPLQDYAVGFVVVQVQQEQLQWNGAINMMELVQQGAAGRAAGLGGEDRAHRHQHRRMQKTARTLHNPPRESPAGMLHSWVR